MREYKGSEIRNIAVVGHGASGKTSLVDALAFVSGSSKRHGSVKDGTALTDHAAEEIERGYSINLGPAFAEWQDTKINLIDTPGYLDFQGDAIAGLAAADGALVVVSATSGVEVGTEKMFREAVARRDPVLFVVSMMDKEHADFDRIYQQIKTRLSNKVIPVEVPVGAGAQLPRRREPLHEESAPVQEGRQDRRVRRDGDPRGVQGAVRSLLRGADRVDLGHRRHAARALPRGRRDLARRSDRRDEGSDEADGALPALRRLQRIELRNAGDPLDDRRADAERVRDGRAARVQGRRGRRDGRDPRDRHLVTGRARVQDDVRAARRRRDVLPAFLRRDQQRRRAVQRHPERRREAQPSVGRAGKGPHRDPGAPRRRHRLRRQAAQHAHQRHAVDASASGAAAAHRVPRWRDPDGGARRQPRGRREAPGGPASPARRGPDLRGALQRRDARDDRLRTRRAASRGGDVEAQTEIWRDGRAVEAAHRVPRDDQG